MKGKATAVLSIIFFLLLVGCTASKPNAANSNKTERSSTSEERAVDSTVSFSSQTLKGLNSREAINIVNNLRLSNASFKAVVTIEEETFKFSKGETVSIALPEDRTVIAIAPYVSKTHSCGNHNLKSCKGELFDVPVKVVARKASDGTVLFDDNVTTMDNGFLELWLPRDMDIDLTLVAEGRKATGKITTFKDSKTCITTFKLLKDA